MIRIAGVLGTMAALALLPSCELLSLTLDADCDPTSELACAGLDRRFSVADDACERWYCDVRAHACTFGAPDRDGDGATDAAHCASGTDCDDRDPARHPEVVEVCDGVDQDCDAWIDEDPAQRTRPLTPDGDAPTVLPSDGVDDVTLVLATAGAGYAEVVRNTMSTTSLRALDVRSDTLAPSLASAHDATWAYEVYQSDTFHAPSGSVPSCRSPIPSATDPGWACDTSVRGAGTFDALTLSALPDAGWIAAAVDTSVCAGGRVRVGLVDGTPLTGVVDTPGGPFYVPPPVVPPISNVWLGVDLDTTSACTGSAGGHAPAILAVPGSTEYRGHALLAYRDGPRPTAECGAPASEVRALGLFVEQRATSRASYVSAEGDAAPRSLGSATGYAPPAIAHLDGDGVNDGAYFVAFTSADGVHVVQIDDPTEAPPVYAMIARTIPLFGATQPLGTVPATDAEMASITARAYTTPAGIERWVGLAWREGCATNAVGVVAAAALRIDPTGAVSVLPRVVVAPAGIAPSIAVAGTGPDDAGVLFVGYIPAQRGQVMAARLIQDANRTALVASAPRPVYERVGSDVRAAMLRTLETQSPTLPAVPYLFVVDDTRPLLGGPLMCAREGT